LLLQSETLTGRLLLSLLALILSSFVGLIIVIVGKGQFLRLLSRVYGIIPLKLSVLSFDLEDLMIFLLATLPNEGLLTCGLL